MEPKPSITNPGRPSTAEFVMGTAIRVVAMLVIVYYVYQAANTGGNLGLGLATILVMVWIRDEIRGAAMRQLVQKNNQLTEILSDTISASDMLKTEHKKMHQFAMDAIAQARAFRNGAVFGMFLNATRQEVPLEIIEAAVMRAGLKDVVDEIVQEYDRTHQAEMEAFVDNMKEMAQ